MSKKSRNNPPNFSPTSVDIGKLRQATSLKEIYKLAGKMSVGSSAGQRALSWVVNEYMMECCASHDLAVREAMREGLKFKSEITENVRENPHQFMASSDLEFDRVIYAESARLTWLPPDGFAFSDILSSIFPVSQQRRVMLYLLDENLIHVSATMFTDAL